MKKERTELIFILDKSGSMSGLEKDTIGGFNSMLLKQKESGQEITVTTVLFDHGYTLLHDRITIQAISPITETEYVVGGNTALLDAMGTTIQKIAQVQKQTAEEYQAKKVLFVIITDGEENSSREFSAKKVKKLVEQQKKHFGWEFIFLGANIDAITTARSFGIDAHRAQNYHADEKGIFTNYDVLSDMICGFATSARISPDWNAKIQQDMTSRKKS